MSTAYIFPSSTVISASIYNDTILSTEYFRTRNLTSKLNDLLTEYFSNKVLYEEEIEQRVSFILHKLTDINLTQLQLKWVKVGINNLLSSIGRVINIRSVLS